MMTYDGLVVAAVVVELNKALSGARIQSVRQHNDTDLTIEARAPGRTHRLFLSVDARFPRVYLTSESRPVPQAALQFCMLLRKHLEGAFVAKVEQVNLDRIITFRIGRANTEPYSLVHEIMGKHSNLILVDCQGKILGAAKHVGASISRVRQVLPGRQYTSPPGTVKLDLTELDKRALEDICQAKGDEHEWEKWLVEKFSGFGPFLAGEILTRAGLQGRVTPHSIASALSELADIIRNKSYKPVFISDERGRDVMVYPIQSAQFPTSQQHERASINEALDSFFRSALIRVALEDERSQLLMAIRRALVLRNQTLKSVERTLEESSNAERYRQLGELLLANLGAIEKGVDSARVIDYFDPTMPEIAVELDKKLTPQENAARYFKRYQKARDAASTALRRRQEILEDLNALKEAAVRAESAATPEALASLKQALTDRGLLRPTVSIQQIPDEFEGHKIRRMVTADGWEVLYGENARANDYLTQRIARPNDIWLHARAAVGAHVVLRSAGHPGPPSRSVLLAAAEIAARNSEAKNSSLVPVDYTLKKYVRKPRGAAPGFVTYTQEKTIDVALKD